MKPGPNIWKAYLAAGLLGIAGYYALPRGGLAQGLLITALGLATAVALANRTRAEQHGRRRPWAVITLGQALYAAGLATWFPYVVIQGRPLSYPSVADGLLLPAYGLLAIGLALLIRARDPNRDRAGFLDALIVTAAAAVLAWVFVLHPDQRPSGLSLAAAAVSYAYPTLDIVMLALVVRLAFTAGQRPPSFYLVALGLVSQLTADTGFTIASLDGTYRYGGPIDAGLMAMCILLGAAALHPRAGALTRPATAQPRSTPAWRFALLGGSVLTPSVTIIVMQLRHADHDDVAVVAALSAVLSLLALARVVHLTRVIAGRRQADVAAERERLLLQLLQAATLAANEAATLPATLGRVLVQVGALLGWPLGRAVLVGADVNATPIWYINDQHRFAEPAHHLEQSTGIDELARTAAVQGSPVWTTSLPAPLAALGLRSALSVPVVVETEAVAVVQFLTDQPYEPDRGLLEVAASIATQLARVVERVRGQDKLAHQALHDPLTGLPNRALFHDRLAQAVADAARRGERLALTMLDLDGFKEVNDNLGHVAGDHLLVVVADRLRACLRATDTAARIGGDELAVVLPTTDQAEAEAVTSRILERIRHPVVIDGRELLPQASAGIALWNQGQELDSLLRNADAAMYSAKQEPSSSYQVYDQDLHARVLDRISLASDLRGALRREEFVVHYQPIVEAATGRIAGAEALIRWHHPQRGPVSPAQFIPIAEQTGAIVEIGHWVLETACQEAQRWHRDHPSKLPLYVSVNLSPRQLRDPGLTSDIQDVLVATGLPANSLTLEITETAVINDIDRTIDKLHELKGLAARLAIDDFGTGYSSLTYLRRLPIDVVKIDRSFVAGVAAASDEWALAQSIVRLIRALKLETVAEGVETGAQVAHLRALGCDRLQGYYFAKAEPAERFRELLTAPSRTAAPGG
jgi:diguanylate cyclase (GGDEF)-like protein